MNIGEAVERLRSYERVTRTGWNGKGMYLEIQMPDMNSKMSLPYIFMRTVDGNFIPWLCSQGDILAEDWEVVAE